MSDGPHRSLPMSRRWKRLAEFAENENFDPADISKAALRALAEDWHDGVPAPMMDGVRGVFLPQQAGLFPEQRIEPLEALEQMTAGHGLARLFVDCATASLNAGVTGEAALVDSLTNALVARAARGARQIEEHYCREATTALAKNVRARLEEGIRGVEFRGLARELLKLTPGTAERRSLKHQGLDDGVPL